MKTTMLERATLFARARGFEGLSPMLEALGVPSDKLTTIKSTLRRNLRTKRSVERINQILGTTTLFWWTEDEDLVRRMAGIQPMPATTQTTVKTEEVPNG